MLVLVAAVLATVSILPLPAAAMPAAGGVSTKATGAGGTCLGVARASPASGALLLRVACKRLVRGPPVEGRPARRAGCRATSTRQRAGFLWAEARWTVAAGVTGGLVAGTVIALQLVTILKWIFDPPPEHPAVPWPFLAVLVGGTVAAAVLATAACVRWTSRVDPSLLRDL